MATKFKVGDGVTWFGYTDRYAGTVIEVSTSGKRIKVQRDNAEILNGRGSGEDDALHFEPGGFCGHMSGTQRYEYSRDPEGIVTVFSLRKNGKWAPEGVAPKNRDQIIHGRHEHYDYNF